jgi:predicted amidohydrolase YtcJ
MRGTMLAMALCAGPLAALSAVAPAVAADATTVLSAARIHTMDASRPQATAMAFDSDGRILALGETEALLRSYPQARRLDLGAATVIPGLIDAHAHIADLGMTQLTANLVGARDKGEVLERLRTFAADLPPEAWLIGRGWDQNDWPGGDWPTAADLDAAFPQRPVWLERVDGHAWWANSAALRAVKRDLSGDWQPEGGEIRRDAQGRATGVFIDSAMELVRDARPPVDAATAERALLLGMRDAAAHGLTGVHDAGVVLADFKRYQRLADRGQMPLRITAMAAGDEGALDYVCEHGLYRHPSGRLQLRTVKVYGDGALGSRGAALLADYSDDPGNRGLMRTSRQEQDRIAAKARGCGVQVATHAIGDQGNHETLEVYAQALGDAVGSDHRWRIEHAQVLAPQDLARLAQMGVIAAMQPTHATSDMPWAQQRLGPERITGAYAWRQLRDAGTRLALGSDFPVESVDPRLGLYAAVTRTDAEGAPVGGWMPQEKLTAFEALRGFTLDAAYAGFAEQEVGSLEPGKRADFVVLGEDPLAVAPERLRLLSVRATYVDGKPVYEAAEGGSTRTP